MKQLETRLTFRESHLVPITRPLAGRFGMGLAAMKRLCGVLLGIVLAGPLIAEDRVLLGMSSFSTNDAYGDFQDRWQTASWSNSIAFGPQGTTTAPAKFGSVLELRSGYQIITPENTAAPAPSDRPVAGVLRSGIYTHFQRWGADIAIGAGVEAMGPATQVTALQDRFHAFLGFDRIAAPVLAGQMGNALRPMVGGEAAWPVSVDDYLTFRPFAEARTGLETYGRVGFDLLIGDGFGRGILARDYVTGQLYNVTDEGQGPAVSVLLGADAAGIVNSQLLPSGMTANPLRARLRGGMLVQDEAFSLFYGATYLGTEFQGQAGGQLLGSFQIQMRF